MTDENAPANPAADDGLTNLELRLPKDLTDYIDGLSTDTGVSRNDVASVIAAMAIRRAVNDARPTLAMDDGPFYDRLYAQEVELILDMSADEHGPANRVELVIGATLGEKIMVYPKDLSILARTGQHALPKADEEGTPP